MKERDFKPLFDNYKISQEEINKKWDGNIDNKWENVIKEWEGFYVDIVSSTGLPIERWVKKPDGSNQNAYLPYFIEHDETHFGSASPGYMKHNMIYLIENKSGNGKAGNYVGSYYNGYKKGEEYDKSRTDPSSVETDYNNHIKPLLETIVEANNLDAVYAVEKSDRYKCFSAKQILRKITVLMSVMGLDDISYHNAFLWIYDENIIDILAKLLECDLTGCDTFFKKNRVVYDRAKKWAFGNNSTPTKEDYVKLYDFLWSLLDSSATSYELTNFSSANIIYHGAPGTGKTYGVTKNIETLQSIDKDLFKAPKFIQFHPSYTYQDFIEGIKPVGIVQGNLNLQVVNGSFKEFCIFVKKENEQYYRDNYINNGKEINFKTININDFTNWPHYYFVVDEINRGNLSSIFGETFTLLEYRDYDFSGNYTSVSSNLVSTALSSVINKLIADNQALATDLAYKTIDGKVYFGIPFNIHFIGLMNDVDRSIDTFDLALRRRFKWIAKSCEYDVIKQVLANNNFSDTDIKEYVDNCENLNKFICDTSYKDGFKNGLGLGKTYEIGHSFFLKIIYTSPSDTLKERSKEVFDSYIEGTLKEYIRQVAEESAVDDYIKKAREEFGI